MSRLREVLRAGAVTSPIILWLRAIGFHVRFRIGFHVRFRIRFQRRIACEGVCHVACERQWYLLQCDTHQRTSVVLTHGRN